MENQKDPNNQLNNSAGESADAAAPANAGIVPNPSPTVPPNTPLPTAIGQPQPGPRSRKKLIIFGLIVILVVAGIGVAAAKLLSSPKALSNHASSSTLPSPIQWVKYNDPTLGFTFSYPNGWHISDSKTTKEPAGRTIYIGPHAINTDPESLKRQYLDDPQLGFYIFSSNPAGNLDNQPISAPDKNVGTITLATGKSSALIEDKFTSYDDTVTLSACSNASCTFKIGNQFMSPSIKTLGSVAGLDGHDIDQSGSTYKTELKIWQSINY